MPIRVPALALSHATSFEQVDKVAQGKWMLKKELIKRHRNLLRVGGGRGCWYDEHITRLKKQTWK
jgi:hypothetical protein